MDRIRTILARMALLAALAGLTAPALAQDAAGRSGEPPPLPPPRPVEAPAPPSDDGESEAETGAEDAPSGKGPDVPATPEPEHLTESDVEFAACLAALDVYGAGYEIAAPIESEDAGCGVARPLRVKRIVPGVDLLPEGIMRCAAALALAEWVSGFVLPAAAYLPDRGRLTGLEHGAAYVCRRRNNAPDGQLSEHAFGNAVDITGFRFAEGGALAVEPRAREGDIEEAFQRAFRATACLSFTTVIGPGADAAHADHLHLDVKARSRGYRLCQ